MPLTLAQLRAAVQALAEAGSTELKQQLGDPSLGGGQIIVIPPAGTRPRGEWWVFGSKWVDALLGGIADEVTTYVGGTTMDVNLIQVGGVALPAGGPVPVSGAVTNTPPANQSVDLTKVAGVALDTNTGNASAGTQRVVLATNQPAVPVTEASLDATIADANGAKPAKVQQIGGYVSPAFTLLRAIEIDAGNGVVECDSAHHEIHEGVSFSAHIQVPATNNNASYDVLIKVGTGAIHVIPSISTSLGASWGLYETPTTTADGTATTVNNRRRSSQGVVGFVSTSTVFANPTVTATGTQLDGEFLGSGGAGAKTGGQSRGMEEWVLKPATNYLIRVTNLSGSNGMVGTVHLHWYQDHDANGMHIL